MPLLVIQEQGQEEAELKLDPSRNINIGRSPISELAFDGNTTISRNHCLIYYHPDYSRYCISDLGSTNGTYLNGTRLEGDAFISHGDEIGIGNITIIYEDEEKNALSARRPSKVAKAVNAFGFGAISTQSGNINVKALPSNVRYQKTYGCSLREGQKVNNYQIIEKFTDGPFSSLYLVKDTESSVTLSLKLYDKDFSNDIKAQETFLKSIQNISRLNHPSLIRYYEAGIYEGHCFLVMDYLSNGNLKEKIRDKKHLPEKQCLEIVQAIASGLSMAYTQCNVFHGNLNPENILFNRNDEVVVSDYVLNLWVSKYFLDGEPVALPHYISPELIIHKQGIWSADVYSLGILFYQMLTGVYPFTSPRDDEIMKMHVETPLPKPDKRRPDISISDDTMTILYRMTAKNPAGRYDSWGSFLKDVFHAVKDLKTGAADRGANTTVVMPAPPLEKTKFKSKLKKNGKSAKKKILRR